MNTDKRTRQKARLSIPPDILMTACIIASALLFSAGLFLSVTFWFKTYLFAACVILAGYDILFDALIKLVKRRSFDKNILIFVAAVGAFFIGRAPEGAAVVLIFRFGALLQDKLVGRLRNAIEGFLDSRAEIDNNASTTSAFDDSTVSRILKIIEEADNKKSKKEKTITRFARIFTLGVIAIAVILGVFVPLIGGLDAHSWMNIAFGLLVVSVPSALAISVPLTYFSGFGRASKQGVLYKSADVVDKVAHTTSVIFDKTGILTQGRYQVSEINANEISDERLLMLASYAELHSNHPIARAIVAAAEFELDYDKITDFREIKGKGTEVNIGGITVSAGNAMLMEELGLTPDISQAEASVVYIAVNGKYAGRILLTDTVRPDAKKAVKELHAIGIDRIAIFTGDRKEAAVDVASQLGIREFYAEYLPEEKVKRLKGLTDMQLPGDKLIFIGDGISDAPVLKAADVGAAMGGIGSDDAIEAADMVIMTDEPSKIVMAIKLARDTNRIVIQNILMAIAMKGIILLFILIGIAPMWLAVLSEGVVSIAAVYNAARAFGFSSREIWKVLLKKAPKDGEGLENETV